MKLLSVEKSSKPDKKYMATFELESGRTKTTHFGSAGMNDYTLTKDKDARERYRDRHRKDLETNDPTRAGYLSWFILWGPYTSVSQNVEYFKRKYNL